MRLISILIFFIVLRLTVIGQNVMSVNGVQVSIKNGAFISAIDDIQLENNGHFDNSDSIFFTGNWINNAGNTGFSSVNEGYVYMRGADQYIQGNDETHFFNLLLRNDGVKYANLHVYVDGFLDLNRFEFNLDTHTVFVTDADLNAVRNLAPAGFVSSLENGGLSRQMNQNADYFFPVGSKLYGDTLYRPVDLMPASTNPHTYKVRLAANDPNLDGLDRDERELLICNINDLYYHRIWQTSGVDSVNMRFYYSIPNDGVFNDLVHWQDAPEWIKLPSDTFIQGLPWDIQEVYNWGNFTTPEYALAFTKPSFAFAGNDTTIFLLDTIQLDADGGTFYEWQPADALSCTDCEQPIFWDDTTRTMIVTVTDDDNCKDIDSVTVFVDERFNPETGNPFIPTAITPNGDNSNDYWNIRWLYRFPENEVIIVNRWGDEVFVAEPYNNDWYGTWNGKELPGATYYYIVKLKANGQVTNQYSGPLTIVR